MRHTLIRVLTFTLIIYALICFAVVFIASSQLKKYLKIDSDVSVNYAKALLGIIDIEAENPIFELGEKLKFQSHGKFAFLSGFTLSSLHLTLPRDLSNKDFKIRLSEIPQLAVEFASSPIFADKAKILEEAKLKLERVNLQISSSVSNKVLANAVASFEVNRGVVNLSIGDFIVTEDAEPVYSALLGGDSDIFKELFILPNKLSYIGSASLNLSAEVKKSKITEIRKLDLNYKDSLKSYNVKGDFLIEGSKVNTDSIIMANFNDRWYELSTNILANNNVIITKFAKFLSALKDRSLKLNSSDYLKLVGNTEQLIYSSKHTFTELIPKLHQYGKIKVATVGTIIQYRNEFKADLNSFELETNKFGISGKGKINLDSFRLVESDLKLDVSDFDNLLVHVSDYLNKTHTVANFVGIPHNIRISSKDLEAISQLSIIIGANKNIHLFKTKEQDVIINGKSFPELFASYILLRNQDTIGTILKKLF